MSISHRQISVGAQCLSSGLSSTLCSDSGKVRRGFMPRMRGMSQNPYHSTRSNSLHEFQKPHVSPKAHLRKVLSI